ncbi:MAG TPA: hypothetical protein DCS07_13700 [Bdellovibrionales bacterium]|nr:MAG: hypothetical protein A2Z97_11710 [Bdellovibrionales bacterium GWB1_52_6]OFZ05372.1 MAG: hypothetical protein A2X97_16640 [Bdellovibrionales bacterium GWA1_52_35]OFZ43086.1 MAG: hypothetical protein A2070_01640 [Bdellovibrionales bacterium GWC1_52_8]HAR43663.1 hypothetical protein [Bdellovibrionales bacterium]HCM38985.1 hypothetical protein [Bdellovibrionales bacterium]
MIQYKSSILMPLHSGGRNGRSAGQISRAACFAHWLGADLRLLIAPEPDMNDLMKFEEKILARTPRECAFSIETDGKPLPEATKASIERRKPEMVILNIESHFLRRSIRMASWQRQILEESLEPVLVLSSLTKLQPFDSIVVPMKGDPMRMDAALTYSLQIGGRARIPLDILHVSPKQLGPDSSAIGQLSDEFYHEYPRRIEEMIAEASPLSSVRERTIIRDFLQVRGDMTHEIFRSIKKHKSGLLVIEWDGKFARGRSELIRAIILASHRPVLVVKPVLERRSTLTLGNTTIAA